MCMVCGCTHATHTTDGETPHRIDGPQVSPEGDLHYGAGPAGVSVAGLSTERAIRIEADVLGENGRHARTAIGVASLPRNSPVEIQMICTAP